MGAHAAPTCPKCASAVCRESRWRSHDEKIGHPGCHPYRCLDCAHRFIAASAPGTAGKARRTTLAAGLVPLLVVGVGGTLMAMWEDKAAVLPPSPAVEESVETVAGLGPSILAAAEAGDAEAQFRLGRAILQDSSRGKEGAIEAVSWLKRAANTGHARAMVQLGKLYRNGVGIVQNYELAAKWTRAAAEAGEPEGMVELGRLYRGGIGIEANAEQAYIWFNRAAAALNRDGVLERDSIAAQLSPERLKAAQAQSLAAEGGDESLVAEGGDESLVAEDTVR